MASDIRVRVQPVNEDGTPDGDLIELIYPFPEDLFEVTDLSVCLKEDLTEALQDYLPGIDLVG